MLPMNSVFPDVRCENHVTYNPTQWGQTRGVWGGGHCGKSGGGGQGVSFGAPPFHPELKIKTAFYAYVYTPVPGPIPPRFWSNLYIAPRPHFG